MLQPVVRMSCGAAEVVVDERRDLVDDPRLVGASGRRSRTRRRSRASRGRPRAGRRPRRPCPCSRSPRRCRPRPGRRAPGGRSGRRRRRCRRRRSPASRARRGAHAHTSCSRRVRCGSKRVAPAGVVVHVRDLVAAGVVALLGERARHHAVVGTFSSAVPQVSCTGTGSGCRRRAGSAHDADDPRVAREAGLLGVEARHEEAARLQEQRRRTCPARGAGVTSIASAPRLAPMPTGRLDGDGLRSAGHHVDVQRARVARRRRVPLVARAGGEQRDAVRRQRRRRRSSRRSSG